MLGTVAVVGGALIAAAGAAAHGAFHRNSPVFGPALGRLPLTGGEKTLALTFDDGPTPSATPRIVETLAREQVPATFFMLGRHVDRWPAIAAEVAASGATVANHGYHHMKLHRRGRAYTQLDIALGTDAIRRATSMAPRHFRAPHGFRNPWVAGVAAEHGQRVVGWTLGVWDSDRPGAGEIARRCVEGASPGCILLLHDGDGNHPDGGDRAQTADALPETIARLRDAGYRFVELPG